MASQREIRPGASRRSRNIKQITRAMQFVAASKLKRAQDATLAARPYSEKLDEVLADLAAVLGGEDHPLLAGREGGKRLIVLITTDRGLAGPLNTNTIRFAAREITEHEGDLDRRDRRAQGPRRDAPRRRADGGALRRASATGRRSPTSCRSRGSSPTTTSPATYGRVDIIFSRFVSTLDPAARAMDQLLPIEPTEDTEGIPGNQFIFEPSPARSSSSSCRATSRRGCSRRSSRARRARSRAGWSR